ncbi:threonine synthase [Canibacter sp. lx-72]|uniref:threonine synthase n=1 Tax=Canibacter zhuwentaonis TaxID=2837491 RepID=UPI001BDD3825|nr:threonine synthase [Canibacter zhuwentaonis]MBT1017880.1 threonine synthase [Canibacter zhuwentaonis]MBT1035043.1 threonine synthase [Canibacter zhuwentaonis]
MKFLSTRGWLRQANFSDILIEGLAPDGGLTVPEQLPQLSIPTIESWRGLSYPQLAAKVIGIFWDDISEADLTELAKNAYGEQFAAAETVPIKPFTVNFGLVGLSEGPTLAFKDMAMQFLGEAIPYVLKQRGGKLNIIGATSGDTGSAAEYAFKNKPRTSVVMLSPKGRMSAFQRAQMYTLDVKNIHNVVIDGAFDDCQNLVKELNGDLEYKQKYSLGVVNSINFVRLAAQCVYYFWAWLRITDKMSAAQKERAKISFTVPSGNFGNLFSGMLAKGLGLPVYRLVIATNENDVLHELFTTGVYKPRKSADTFITSSPSMDISKASNIERFIYELLGRDPAKLVAAFAELDRRGELDLRAHLPKFVGEYQLASGVSRHANRITTIRQIFNDYKVIIDPHTADGVKVAQEVQESGEIMYVMETAKPQKFETTVYEALGFAAKLSFEMLEMMQAEQHTVEMDSDSKELRKFVARNAV